MVTAQLLGVRVTGPHPDGHGHPEIALNYYCMPQTVGHVHLDTLEDWFQEANVSTILLTSRKH